MTQPNALERADIAVAKALEPYREHPAVKALARYGKLGDQPPLFTLSAAVLAAGLLLRKGRVIEAGARMLAAEALATAIKSVVKKTVTRTRPNKLLDEGEYRAEPGKPEDKGEQSFPSGHTAGAVAVAGALAPIWPSAAVPIYGAAAAIGLAQAPAAKHYLTDIAAGAAVGAVSAFAIDRMFRALWPTVLQLSSASRR
jgi:membrane-associated phospholipid phosphatase